MDKIFELLQSRLDENGFTEVAEGDVDRWAKELGLPVSTFLDQIGAVVAKKYHARLVTFEFCDSLVNQLWGEVAHRLGKHNEIFPWPELFQKVFEAFDAGEYHRAADKSDNPIADFTDPQIAEIVGKLC